MALVSGLQYLEKFKGSVSAKDNQAAQSALAQLKGIMMDLDSLPPMCMESANAAAERKFAREVYEYAAILSINMEDKESFQRYIASLRPYYTTMKSDDGSELTYTVVGLSLLYLLVENRLADFHCELELLTEQEKSHPALTFCTQLDKHLVVGSYDQVLVAAAHPPVPQYSFFLTSLLETVRVNIGDCISAAYTNITLAAATQMLMFNKNQETKDFVADFYPDWTIEKDVIYPTGAKAAKSDEIPSLRLISQNLSYATEMERIV